MFTGLEDRVREEARRLCCALGNDRAARIARYRARKWAWDSRRARPENKARFQARSAAWGRAAAEIRSA